MLRTTNSSDLLQPIKVGKRIRKAGQTGTASGRDSRNPATCDKGLRLKTIFEESETRGPGGNRGRGGGWGWVGGGGVVGCGWVVGGGGGWWVFLWWWGGGGVWVGGGGVHRIQVVHKWNLRHDLQD